jgi:predicted 3-demethylubiquinone-9 3-methyltransferase (glyoxalase superfamily)
MDIGAQKITPYLWFDRQAEEAMGGWLKDRFGLDIGALKRAHAGRS